MTNISAAIEYSGEVPKIIASARGYLAKKMLEVAKANNVTIYKNSDLAEVLSRMTPGSSIPEDLYVAVAEVLAYCYRMNEEFKKKVDADF